MAEFKTKLITERIDEKLAQLHEPLVYVSDLIGEVVVPKGFVTDFASVPRLPFTFWLTGDIVHSETVVHDYLYTQKTLNEFIIDREIADAVFLEAMKANNVSAWQRNLMWLAVRAFGWTRYK